MLGTVLEMLLNMLRAHWLWGVAQGCLEFFVALAQIVSVLVTVWLGLAALRYSERQHAADDKRRREEQSSAKLELNARQPRLRPSLEWLDANAMVLTLSVEADPTAPPQLVEISIQGEGCKVTELIDLLRPTADNPYRFGYHAPPLTPGERFAVTIRYRVASAGVVNQYSVDWFFVAPDSWPANETGSVGIRLKSVGRTRWIDRIGPDPLDLATYLDPAWREEPRAERRPR